MIPQPVVRRAVAALLFGNAFLLFILQPYVSKRLLPVLGGSAEVWVMCALCFQMALLAGYAMAFLARRLPLGAALGLHGVLLIMGWLSWPLIVGDGPAPATAPALWTMRLLGAQLAFLLIALSATSPLMQYGYARACPRLDPYPLFTASNAGSIAGLVAYPFVVEPWLSLQRQTTLFGAGVILLLGLQIAVSWLLTRSGPQAAMEPMEAAPPISASRRLRWIVLAAVPAVLLLAVTAQITTDIAPMPLLWIVPLAVYLASFIRVFASGWQPSRWTWPQLAVCALLMLLTFVNEPSQLWWVVIHLMILWTASLLCHGALVQERPAPARLPEFYLLLAAGGAMGGWFAGLVAPLVFSMRVEYPLAVLAALWLAPDRVSFTTPLRLTRPLFAGLAVIAIVASAAVAWLAPLSAVLRLVTLVAALGAAACWHRPRWFTVLTAVALLAVIVDRRIDPRGIVLRGRTFYGTYAVRELTVSQTRALFHGTTLHGAESLRPGHRADPLSYYGPQSPIAEVFRQRDKPAMRVAVLGLGAGVILRYAQQGSEWTVYEIDPAIARVAQDPALFTHWTDAAARTTLVLGDGRMRLRDAADASYDLIIADAFASDSVPIHLLTREALALYQRKIRADGAILFNISNRYLELGPVLGATAAHLGLAAFQAMDNTFDDATALFPSHWVLVGSPAAVTPPGPRWTAIASDPGDPGWTDDHSDVLSALWPARWARETLAAALNYRAW